jgi:hypothetical protein
MLQSKRRFLESGLALAFVAPSAMTSNDVGTARAQGASPPPSVPTVPQGTPSIPPDILELLDPGDADDPMTATLSRKFDFGSATYYVIEQYQASRGLGEPVVIRKPASGQPVVLADFTGLPPEPMSAGTEDQAKYIELGLFAMPESELTPDRFRQGPVAAQATELLDRTVFNTASSIQLDTSAAAGTNGGRLACAWAVNQVVNRALKKPILAGSQGLSTANLAKVLASKHVRVNDPIAGCIVISPTVYSPRTNIGHVGIVGQSAAVYSNSSSKTRWEQNFTLEGWIDYYQRRKGLSVQFYRLDDIYFPRIG